MTPGLLALLGILVAVVGGLLITWTLALVAGWREDDEDTARALRIQREYFVPDEAVALPTGRRTPLREWPEIVSRYRDEVSR